MWHYVSHNNYIGISMSHSSKKAIPPLWILGIASSLSPFGMVIIVPALSSIVERFDASLGEAQFVISAYLCGLAVAQPICGYLCDRYGRRPVMLFGFGFFTITSVLCAFANSLDQLVLARFLQAVSVSVGTVASRAILRDSYDADRMAEAMSYIAAAMGIAPVLAPLIGGSITATSGYTGIFMITSAIGLAVFIGMYLSLSETLKRDHLRTNTLRWYQNYRILLSSRSFIGNTLVFGFVQGGIFSFLAVGSTLFATEFDIGPGTFGLLWGLMAISYIVGASLAARLTPVLGSKKIMHLCIYLGVASGILISITKIMVPLAFLTMFTGGTTPGSMTAAVVDHPQRVGTASGLSSSLGLVISGLFTVICGIIYTGDYRTIAFIIFLSTVAAAAAWLYANSGKLAVTDPR